MKIGTECGESIPAKDRVKKGNEFEIHFPDATLQLGHYIGLLATEYKRLEQSGLSTLRTIHELDLAIGAYERLEKYSKGYCDDIYATSPCNPGLNVSGGFFIRDDVPGDYFIFDNAKHFNRPGIANISPTRTAVSYPPSDAYSTPKFTITGGSAFTGRADDPNFQATHGKKPVPTEMSQDQVKDLWLGFAMTIKYVNNSGIKARAEKAIKRLTDKIGIIDLWRIQNPSTNQCVYGVNPSNSCLDAGAIMNWVAHGVSKATNKVYSASNLAFMATLFGWNSVYQGSQFVNIKIENSMSSTYAAIARNWRIGIWPFSVNSTWFSLKRRSVDKGLRNPHIPLVYKLYYPGGGYNGIGFAPENTNNNVANTHNGNPGNKCPSYLELLNSAPTCGPHNHAGVYQSWEWSGGNRLNEEYHRCGRDQWTTNYYADYNGIDYMYLLNLYSLVNKSYFSSLGNPYYWENFNVDYPTGSGIGSNTNKLQLNFLEFVSLKNKINDKGNVVVRGAKAVEMLPGFDSKWGSVFCARIEDYACSGDEGSEAYQFIDLEHPNESFCEEGSGCYNPWGGEVEIGEEEDSEYWIEDSISETLITEEMIETYRDSLENDIMNSGNDDMIQFYFDFLNAEGENGQRSAIKDDKLTDSEDIAIYPNPTTGLLSILLSNDEAYDIKVYDAIGKLIISRKGCLNNCSIDLSKFANGQYLIKLINKDETIIRKITMAK